MWHCENHKVRILKTCPISSAGLARTVMWGSGVAGYGCRRRRRRADGGKEREGRERGGEGETSSALISVASSCSLNMSLNLDSMPSGGPASTMKPAGAASPTQQSKAKRHNKWSPCQVCERPISYYHFLGCAPKRSIARRRDFGSALHGAR